MQNKLTDAYSRDRTITISFTAGAGEKSVNLDIEQAAKTAAVLIEWVASQVEIEIEVGA